MMMILRVDDPDVLKVLVQQSFSNYLGPRLDSLLNSPVQVNFLTLLCFTHNPKLLSTNQLLPAAVHSGSRSSVTATENNP